jgi:hypothetical protein
MTQAEFFADTPPVTLAERCAHYAKQVAEYEMDITDRAPLELTQIRRALEEAAEALK